MQKVRGHHAYFGITSNYDAIARFTRQVSTIWRTWLSRRSQKAALTWSEMQGLLRRWPLPVPRIVHRYGT